MANENKDITTGSCVCKGVTFELVGPAKTSWLCHCIQCKKSSGSAFTAHTFYNQDQFHIKSGEELIKTYIRTSDSGKPVPHEFCSTCGSPLFIRSPRSENVTAVPTGLLDIYDGELEEKGPAMEYYMKRKCGWLGEIESSEGRRFDGMTYSNRQ